MKQIVHVFHAGHCPEEYGVVYGVCEYVRAMQLPWQVIPHNTRSPGMFEQSLARLSPGDVAIGRLRAHCQHIINGQNIHWIEWATEGSTINGTGAVLWNADSIGHEAALYLSKLGIRRFAVLDTEAANPPPNRLARQNAFKKAIHAMGLYCHTIGLTSEGRYPSQDVHLQNLEAFVRSHPERVGIFLYHDRMAEILMDELLQIGLRIPEEVIVIGGSCSALAHAMRVPLTTVRLPFHELGRRAAIQAQQILSGSQTAPYMVDACGVIERASSRTHRQSDHPVIRQAHARIENQKLAIPSVSELAKHCKVCRQTLLTHFRRHLHCSVEQWLGERAMQRCAHLLIETSMSMSAIAQSCGISQRTNLATRFKQRYGLSAREFRKRNKI